VQQITLEEGNAENSQRKHMLKLSTYAVVLIPVLGNWLDRSRHT